MGGVDALTGKISIHAPREGSDLPHELYLVAVVLISIHAPREGSDLGLLAGGQLQLISIHAPREGSDLAGHSGERASGDFNPRSP